MIIIVLLKGLARPRRSTVHSSYILIYKINEFRVVNLLSLSSKNYRKVQTSVAFKNIQNFPTNDPDIRDLKIMVDKKHESVIIPIFGNCADLHFHVQ